MPRGRPKGPGSGRGGNDTTPARPAAVSGPGALSRRTDGGPSQPIRPLAGGVYGDRQASIEQQQAAPMAGPPSGSALSPPGAVSNTVSAPVGGPGLDPFGPTDRLGESIMTGAIPPERADPDAPDPDLAILASSLPLLEIRASQPGASEAFKILVKRIRSTAPIQPSDFEGPPTLG